MHENFLWCIHMEKRKEGSHIGCFWTYPCSQQKEDRHNEKCLDLLKGSQGEIQSSPMPVEPQLSGQSDRDFIRKSQLTHLSSSEGGRSPQGHQSLETFLLPFSLLLPIAPNKGGLELKWTGQKRKNKGVWWIWDKELYLPPSSRVPFILSKTF